MIKSNVNLRDVALLVNQLWSLMMDL